MEHEVAVSLVQLADLDVLFSSSHSMQPGPASQIPGPLPQASTYLLRPGVLVASVSMGDFARALWLMLPIHRPFL